jgi:hypothetical protein
MNKNLIEEAKEVVDGEVGWDDLTSREKHIITRLLSVDYVFAYGLYEKTDGDFSAEKAHSFLWAIAEQVDGSVSGMFVNNWVKAILKL